MSQAVRDGRAGLNALEPLASVIFFSEKFGGELGDAKRTTVELFAISRYIGPSFSAVSSNPSRASRSDTLGFKKD
jgi:hypothetical protein